MKRLFLFNILLLSISAFSADVKIGNENVSIAFEDETLKEADKAIIIEDIRLVFPAKIKMNLKPYSDNEPPLSDRAGYIDFDGKSFGWSDVLWDNNFFHYRINPKTSKKELVVSRPISDAYLQAIKFKKTHKKEFKALDKFLKRIEMGFQPEKMTMAEKKELFWFIPGTPAWKDEYYDSNLHDFQYVSFKYPSLLTFAEREFESPPILSCLPIMVDKEGTYLEQKALVYDKNKWKFPVFY